jgi:hypothetical protein
MLFDAVEAQRFLVDEATLKTKAARRHRQRRAEATPPAAIPTRVVKQNEPRVIECPKAAEQEEAFEPFEIEEWS